MEKVNPSGETNNEEEFWTLSGTKPFFNVIIAKSHLYPNYQLKLAAKLHPLVPCLKVPAVLAYEGKEWSLMYNGINKKFDTNWRKFAVDNGLKIGDAVVFELCECIGGGANAKLVFRVQILSGEIPPGLAPKIPGASATYPIDIM